MVNGQTIIIGAGPAGASAAIYLARFFHPVTLIDAPGEVFGRTSMATSLENFLGHTKPVSGSDFLARIDKHLARFPIERKNEKVVKLSRRGQLFAVETTVGSYEAPYLVLAVGLSDNMPDIDGLDPYYEHAIYHCLTCDWYQHKDSKLAVIANDDKGIDTALMIAALHRPPSLVVIPAKEPTFSSSMIQKAREQNITVHASPLVELIGKDGYLKSVRLADGANIGVEVLLTKLGHQRFDNFLDMKTIPLERESEEGFIKVNWQTFESSAPNLFAVGPCNEGPDQAIIAAGQGALAALEIHRRITLL